jgi:hypothetical protein
MLSFLCGKINVLQFWDMNNEYNTERQREWARQLYLYNDLPLKDIALQVGIGENVLRGWVNEGDWSGVRRSLLSSKELLAGRVTDLLEHLTERMKQLEEPNPRDTELLLKFTSALKNLTEEIDIPTIVQVAKLFTSWLRRKNTELAQEVTVQFDHFLKHRMSTNPVV